MKRAGIILTHQNKYLLVQGLQSKKWSFPKGCIENGETTLQCAIRELEEETGVKLNKHTESLTKEYIYHDTHLFSFTSVRPDDINVSINDRKEILKIGWFTAYDLKKLTMNERNRCLGYFIEEHINPLFKKPKKPVNLPDDDGWILK
jgi:mRNA-decapping enzyme subunit 2